MKVEVQIGTIEIDALPEGMSAEGLRAAVIGALQSRILADGLPGIPSAGGSANTHDDAPGGAIGAQIANEVFGELGQ
jgi:hypothetical protein